jgi:hypothetical protein
MANLYVLLDPKLGPEVLRQFTEAVEDNGGRLIVFLPPQIVLLDGDAATNDALEGLVGGAVIALGFEDVANLALAAFGSAELTRLIAVLALTTSAAMDAAELFRPLKGEVWPAFGCIPEQA